MLDDNQLTAFLTREANRLELKQLDQRTGSSRRSQRFLQERRRRRERAARPGRHARAVPGVYALLRDARALPAADLRPADRPRRRGARATRAWPTRFTRELRHLIVDEYQDVNPAQERLIELLDRTRRRACVVGDDDQAIYQWRGSDVANIVTSRTATRGVAKFKITTTAAAGPQIIDDANAFAQTIPDRLAKKMEPAPAATAASRRSSSGRADDEADEAGWIAEPILDLARRRRPLPRHRGARPRPGRLPGILEQLRKLRHPGPARRPHRPLRPARGASCSARPFAWLADIDWRGRLRPRPEVTVDDLLDEYAAIFELDAPRSARRLARLEAWKAALCRRRTARANLVGDSTSCSTSSGRELGPRPTRWRSTGSARSRGSRSARRLRVRPPPRAARPRRPGEQVGGAGPRRVVLQEPRDPHPELRAGRLRGLRRRGGRRARRRRPHDGPPGQGPRVAGRLRPVAHRRALPDQPDRAGRRTGSCRASCSTPPATRARDADERRLFYVAMTRARDWLSVSRHERVNKQPRPRRPVLPASCRDLEVDAGRRSPAATSRRRDGDDDEPIAAHLQRARGVPRLRRWPSGCATSSASSRRSPPSSATARPSTTCCARSPSTRRRSGAVPDAAEIDELLDASSSCRPRTRRRTGS